MASTASTSPTAGALARKPELMKYVLGPILHLYRTDVPDRIDIGTQGIEIETDDGWRGAPTRLFVRLMFRHRHRRWDRLSRMLSGTWS
jgi:hypothetical protein